jgi:K+/H+ antiporter YhaU regulatory subunit KhtT
MLSIIDPTVSLGNILTIITVVGAVMTFIWTMKGDVNILKNDIRYLQESQKSLTEAFSQLGKILTSVAVQDTRITMIEKRIDELAHGQGYVDARKNA